MKKSAVSNTMTMMEMCMWTARMCMTSAVLFPKGSPSAL